MVAYLQDGVADDDRLAAKTSEKPKPAGLPLTHEAALKWFYKDPQGEIQGETGRRCQILYAQTMVLFSVMAPLPLLNLFCSFFVLRSIQ